MRFFYLVFLTVFLFLNISCGGGTSTPVSGGGGGTSDTVDNTDNSSTDADADISRSAVSISSTPLVGSTFTISLNEMKDAGTISWSLVSAPINSTASLMEGDTSFSVSFTPDEEGSYTIVASSSENSSQKRVTFTVQDIIAYEQAKISGYDGISDIKDVQGEIVNQKWVFSSTLSSAEIINIIDDYTEFTVAGTDEYQGVLIEYDETDISAIEAVESLKLEKGIDSVYPRTYTGRNIDRTFTVTPSDFYEDPYDDGAGMNWYVEPLNGAGIINAWDYTTGTDDFFIGVVDVGINEGHEDLNERLEAVLTDDNDKHGTAVSGIIGAIADNEIGVAGINWLNKIVMSSIYMENDHPGSAAINYARVVAYNDDGKIVKLINNSWGPMGNDSPSIRFGISKTRGFRAMASVVSDRLHIWAAGNDGDDSRKQNGALHLNNDSEIDRLDNVIVVGAYLIDGTLATYSDFGETVDIAAPTEFLGLWGVNNEGVSTYYVADAGKQYGTNWSGGFNGTSAAAPVVTGVASLIYAMNPSFTPAEVKKILIESATENITRRYWYLGLDENSQEIDVYQDLEHEIPKLDADAALAMARQWIDERVTVRHQLRDRFSGIVDVYVEPLLDKYDPGFISFTAYASEDGETWEELTSGTQLIYDYVFLDLDSARPYYRVDIEVPVTDTETNQVSTITKSYDFFVRYVQIQAQDNLSLNGLNDVAIEIDKVGEADLQGAGATADNGVLGIYLEPGTYKLHGDKTGYLNGLLNLHISEPEDDGAQEDDDSQDVVHKFPITSSDKQNVSAVEGTVYGPYGAKIAGVSVRISGGNFTNGYLASAVTDERGRYTITNISKTDTGGQRIPSFDMTASKDGYEMEIAEDIILLAGKTKRQNFFMTEAEVEENEPEPTVYFSDDFESDKGWKSTYYWHRQELQEKTIANTFYDSGVEVAMAPDEKTDVPYLPAAYSGSYAYWFGEEATGSFQNITSLFDYSNVDYSTIESPYIDPEAEFDYNYEYSFYGGRLTSPAIDLTDATSPVLEFQTWWEIESVNPNSQGYDIMAVEVSTNGTDFVNISKLNPYIDHNDDDRMAKPFTSGGFNRAPVWAAETIDLSAYAGETVYIQFVFNTVDMSYNKFRGWMIDDFSVTESEEEARIASRVKPRVIKPKIKPRRR
ncbi:MAG: hypothetical protein C0602_02250 [Denitrovibrio sp.]|nr:MAG: hypothetical protein C0602_02250 [Denitrovibrio sp.]